jgi:hypothetical protein
MCLVYRCIKYVSKPTQANKQICFVSFCLYKLKGKYDISPDITRHNIVEFERKIDDDVVFFYGRFICY